MLLEAASLQNWKLKAAAEPQQGPAEDLPGKRGAPWVESQGRLGGTLWCLRDPLLHDGCAAGYGLWANVPNTLPALQMLSLQQQMVENLVIAKAREETVSFLVVRVCRAPQSPTSPTLVLVPHPWADPRQAFGVLLPCC